MYIAIMAIKSHLSNVEHNIKVYEKMPEHHINDADRKKTLDDLRKMKKGYHDAIKVLSEYS